MPINLLTKNDFEPRTAEQAAAWFGRKVAVPSHVFDKLSDEAKTEAFRIAGVHNARLIQRARNVVKKAIAQGTAYRDTRIKLLEIFQSENSVSPALSRLRFVFQQNSMQAYNDARRATLDDPDVTPAFPFRMYMTVGNGEPGVRNVRPEHAALHKKVFAWDDPFWDLFTPPWDWGCRCTVVPLTANYVKRNRIQVRDLSYVQKSIAVPGGKRKRGIKANDSFLRGKLNFKSIDREIREALEELLS